jgi:hypothetical protein
MGHPCGAASKVVVEHDARGVLLCTDNRAAGRRYHMELTQRVQEEIDNLKPRLQELGEGEVEVISVDEKTGTVTLRIFGGRLH